MNPRRLLVLLLIALPSSTLVAGQLGGDRPSPARIVVEESLVWRTRVEPLRMTDWEPLGVSFGAGKPEAFVVEEASARPFAPVEPFPAVVQGAKSGWSTESPFQFRGRQGLETLRTDAPWFGVRVASDHPGLKLLKPTLLLDPGNFVQLPLKTSAKMPDGVEFRVERGSGDAAVFSIHNGDPRSSATFHNLRFAIAREREIPLEDAILLDATIPLAHPFATREQAEAPPLVRPKAGFVTFSQAFPDQSRSLTLAPSHHSREFVLGTLGETTWIYVEGFATRSDRDGRPILNEKGLPEEPSEFRYGFRLARRRPIRLDLTSHLDAPTEGPLDGSGETPGFESSLLTNRGGLYGNSPVTSAGGFFPGQGLGSPGLTPLSGGRGASPPGFDPSAPWVGPTIPGAGPATFEHGGYRPDPAPPPTPTPTPAIPDPPLPIVPEPSTLVGGILGGLILAWGRARLEKTTRSRVAGSAKL